MEREEHCKQILLACVGSAHNVWTILGFPQLTVACSFWLYTAQAPGCSAGELSKAGPVFRVLPRSKPLRFRRSGSPHRCRLGWACILCSSQVRASQMTRCLASMVAATYHLPRPCRPSFLGVQLAHLLRRMLTVQNPKKSQLAMKPACSLVDNASLGP